MAFGIHKQGQGYWVRVMTASMLGILTLSCAAWVWGQAQLVASKLPRPQWVLKLDGVQGQPGTGATVELLGDPPTRNAEPPVFGTAQVQGWDVTNRELTVRSLQMEQDRDPGETRRIRAARASAPPDSPDPSATAPSAFRAEVTVRTGIPIIQPGLLQGISAAMVLLLGALLTYWLVGVKRQSAEFLIATDMEMRKVNWSTRRDIIASTWVVIAWTFVIASALFLIDLALQGFFRGIGILRT